MKERARSVRSAALLGALILALTFLFSSCDEFDPGFDDFFGQTDPTSQLSDYDYSDNYLYYYSQLDRSDKVIYDGLYKALTDGTEQAEFSDLGEADIDRVLRVAKAVEYDHPEIFFYKNAYNIRYVYSRGGGGPLRCVYRMDDYWANTSSLSRYAELFEKKVAQIVAQTERYCDSDFEKAKFVHDYLVTNTTYDHEAVDDVLNNPTGYNPYYDLVFSSYGCLVNQKCVCAGFAKAYKVILDRLGIPCVYVIGWGDPYVKSNVGHAWNRIVLDSDSYYVDVTWDNGRTEYFDSNGVEEYPDAVTYPYFNITTDELCRTHMIDEANFPQPECNSTKYNYYAYSGYLLYSYDYDRFVEMVNAQRSLSTINIRCANESDVERAKKDFVKDEGYRKLGWIRGFSHIFDEESGCISIFSVQ